MFFSVFLNRLFHGHWWSFSSHNFEIWPMYLLLNVFCYFKILIWKANVIVFIQTSFNLLVYPSLPCFNSSVRFIKRKTVLWDEMQLKIIFNISYKWGFCKGIQAATVNYGKLLTMRILRSFGHIWLRKMIPQSTAKRKKSRQKIAIDKIRADRDRVPPRLGQLRGAPTTLQNYGIK